MIKGIIFDLDGTVLDTSKDLTTAVNRTRAHYKLEPISLEKVLHCVGNGFVVLMNKALPEVKDKDEALEIFKKEYSMCYMDETAPYQGITDMLKKLNSMGIKVGINTNKDDTFSKKLIKKNFPDIEFIDVIGTVPGRNKKPDPAGVNVILEKMAITNEELIYMGDSDVDLKTALNAKVTPVACTWGFRTKEELINAGAINIIDKPEEVFTYIG